MARTALLSGHADGASFIAIERVSFEERLASDSLRSRFTKVRSFVHRLEVRLMATIRPVELSAAASRTRWLWYPADNARESN